MPQRDAGTSIWSELDGFERLLEHRSRLGICVLLARRDSMSFARLKELLDETDGALGAHLKKLEEAGFITVRKAYKDRKPISWYTLRKPGRKRLASHLDSLQKLIGKDSVAVSD